MNWKCPQCGEKLLELTNVGEALYCCTNKSKCKDARLSPSRVFTEEQLKNYFGRKFQEKIEEYNSSTKKALIVTAIATVITAIAAILALKP